ncbi:hypothetical protein ACWEQA_18735 [Nocardia sp. NPDC004085]
MLMDEKAALFPIPTVNDAAPVRPQIRFGLPTLVYLQRCVIFEPRSSETLPSGCEIVWHFSPPETEIRTISRSTPTSNWSKLLTLDLSRTATGLRRQEFTYLLVPEIPALPPNPSALPIPFRVSAG